MIHSEASFVDKQQKRSMDNSPNQSLVWYFLSSYPFPGAQKFFFREWSYNETFPSISSFSPRLMMVYFADPNVFPCYVSFLPRLPGVSSIGQLLICSL